jgi:hypothetical protein
MEIWKDIPNYEGLYQVSNKGRVKSLARSVIYTNGVIGNFKERILRTSLTLGYPDVVLTRDKKRTTFKVHSIMAVVFLGHTMHSGMTVNHIDGNRANNNLENLEVVTHKQNMRHAFDIGLLEFYGEKNANSKLSNSQVAEIRELLRKGELPKCIALRFGVTASCIYSIKANRIRKVLYIPNLPALSTFV